MSLLLTLKLIIMYDQINRVLYLGAIVTLLSTSLFVSCQNKTEANDDAVVETVETTAPKSDWEMFKEDAEKSIENNDVRIKELKEKISKSDTPNLDKLRQKRIDALQEENTNLRAKIVEYKVDEANSNWEEFKIEVKDELDKISKEFDDLNK